MLFSIKNHSSFASALFYSVSCVWVGGRVGWVGWWINPHPVAGELIKEWRISGRSLRIWVGLAHEQI